MNAAPSSASIEARTPVGEIADRLGRHPSTDLPRAGAQPLPRRRPRVLRLLPPERPGPGAPTPAASPQAGRRRGLARARDRAPEGRLVAAADRRPAQAGARRTAGRRSATRPSTATSTAPRAARTACTATCRRRAGGAGAATAAGRASTPIPRERWIENRPAEVGDRRDLRPLGGRPADLPQGGRQGERDLAGGEEEPVHLPAAERGQALGGGRRRHRRRAPGAARGGPPDGHLRPRDASSPPTPSSTATSR